MPTLRRRPSHPRAQRRARRQISFKFPKPASPQSAKIAIKTIAIFAIREQVAQLTGQRFLGDYTSDDAQYRALMDNGVTVAKAFGLRPGVELTDAQVAALTSDIVWLVSQNVTLPDGSTTQALVPRVYVRVRPGDLDGSGTLIAGCDVSLNFIGDINNSGTIAGRRVVSLTADNLNNSGQIRGQAVFADAKTDLNVNGSSITADQTLVATAGRERIFRVGTSAHPMWGV